MCLSAEVMHSLFVSHISVHRGVESVDVLSKACYGNMLGGY